MRRARTWLAIGIVALALVLELVGFALEVLAGLIEPKGRRE